MINTEEMITDNAFDRANKHVCLKCDNLTLFFNKLNKHQ